MKRKVIKHGQSTLTVSLPYRWVQKFDVKKGDDLEVDEKGDNLIIKPFEKKEGVKLFANLRKNTRFGISYITSAYRAGVDEMNLEFEDSKFINEIQTLILNEVKGFEIINQTDHSCVIRDLGDVDLSDFDLAVKRLWTLLISLADDSFNALKANDKKTLHTIPQRDKSINRFSNYCIRILSQKPFKNQMNFYNLVRKLENLGDEYKDMINLIDENQTSVEFRQIFSSTNKQLSDLHNLYYDLSSEKVERIFQKAKKEEKEILDLSNEEMLLGSFLIRINSQIKSLVSTLIELNLLVSPQKEWVQ